MSGAVLVTALPAAWAALVLGACWRGRPRPSRADRLAPAHPAPARPMPLPAAVRRLAPAGLAGAAALVLWPPLVLGVVAVAVVVPRRRARRVAERRRRRVRRDLPEVVDLVALAVGAGLTVPLAVTVVARRVDGPVGDELGRVDREVAHGRRLADVLDEVPMRLGDEVRPLTAALAASDRYGAPLLAGLERLAADLRADRRRSAESAARRVPVALLFPLVLCILPAFALLTVAPLLAGGLAALRP